MSLHIGIFHGIGYGCEDRYAHKGVDDGMMKTRAWLTLSCIRPPMSIADALIRF